MNIISCYQRRQMLAKKLLQSSNIKYQVCNWIKLLCFESVFSQEKEELLQQNAELRVKLEAKVCFPSQL